MARDPRDPEVPSDLLSLGSGERETIALAQAVDVELVLLDEKRARNAARARGLAVSGTLGVLDLAAARGLVTMTEALGLLEQTTFRAPRQLMRRLHEKYSR
jgi:predicted nucleic acid-binding protein